MSETNGDTPDRLAENELFRIGDYAFGRLGYRPIVSLPASKARAIAVRTHQLEIAGILLFLLSALLFYLGQVGLEEASTVGALVIGVRAITLIANYTVIAQTLNEPRRTDETPDYSLSGERFNWFEGVEMYVGLEDNILNLRFVNNSLHECSISLKVTSDNGLIRIPKNHVEFSLPTQYTHLRVVSPQETIHTSQFDLRISDSVTEFAEDTLIISTYGSRINQDEGTKEVVDERELKVPIEIRNRDEIVVESTEYEILSE